MINAAGVYVDAVRRLDDAVSPVAREPEPGCPPGPRFVVLSRRDRPPGPAHRRRPRALRDPLARPRPGGHDRYAGRPTCRSSLARSTTRSPICSNTSSDTSTRPPASRRRPEHLRRPAAAAARPGRRADGQALARTRRDRLRLRAGHDHRRKMDHIPPHGDRRGRLRDPLPAASPTCLRPPPRSSCTAGRSPSTTAPARWPSMALMRPRSSALCNERPEWSRPLHPALPYLAGEAVWAARHEAARCVDDVLARRTRALFLDARASIAGGRDGRRSARRRAGPRCRRGRLEQISRSSRSWRRRYLPRADRVASS